MKNFTREVSLLKDYFYTSAVIIAVVFVIFICITAFLYRSVIDEREDLYKTEGARVAIELQESFNYLEKSLNFISNKILSVDYNDPQKIDIVLNKLSRFPRLTEDLFTWTMFDFVSPEGYVIVDSIRGVVDDPVKVETDKRSWFNLAKTKPWRLLFSSPDIGLSSGEQIIPTGYGIKDDNEKFIGIVSIGFNVKKLTKKITNLLSKQGTIFVLIDEKHNIITRNDESLYNFMNSDNDIKKINFREIPVDFFKKPIEYEGVTLKYYRKVKNSPYIIIIGDKKSTINSLINRAIFPYFITMFLVTIFFLVILYFFRKKIINPVVLLSNAADKIEQGNITNLIMPRPNSLEIKKLSFQLENIVNYSNDLNKTQQDLALTNQKLRLALDKIEDIAVSKEILTNDLLRSINIPAEKAICEIDFFSKEIKRSDPESEMIAKMENISHLIKFVQRIAHDMLVTDHFGLEATKSNNSTIDVFILMNKIVDLVKEYYSSKQVEFAINFCDEPVVINFDQISFEQILLYIFSDIVENANQPIAVIVDFSFDDQKNLFIEIKEQHYANIFDNQTNRINNFIKPNKKIQLAKVLLELYNCSLTNLSKPDDIDVYQIKINSNILIQKSKIYEELY